MQNGTIDLKTGELRKHDPRDYITQLAPVEYDCAACCPQWQEALSLIFNRDVETVRLLQQLLGYATSGECTEQLLIIFFGKGNNGKSTIVNTITKLLGDYAHPANFELLCKTQSNRHPTEVAQLYQRRFVPVSEAARDSALNEAKIKELTGNDRLTARRMHENFWSFDSTHTFVLSTNHLPTISETDEGIRRRLMVIPFTVNLRDVVTRIHKGMVDGFVRQEGPGILNWLVRGYQDWCEQGEFTVSTKIRQATSDYLKSQDWIGNFIAECCETQSSAKTPLATLYNAYQQFGGEVGKRSFGAALENLGYPKKRLSGGTAGFVGIKLKSD